MSQIKSSKAKSFAIFFFIFNGIPASIIYTIAFRIIHGDSQGSGVTPGTDLVILISAFLLLWITLSIAVTIYGFRKLIKKPRPFLHEVIYCFIAMSIIFHLLMTVLVLFNPGNFIA